VRLFSTKSFKPLGTLIYHKGAVQTLAFAHACPSPTRCHGQTGCGGDGAGAGGSGAGRRDPDVGTADTSETDHSRSSTGPVSGYDRDRDDTVDRSSDDDDDDDDEMSAEEKVRRSRWLVSGGKDGRVAVWALMDFNARNVTSTATATDE
jgi:ASTRA-associated protein 1